MTTIEHPLPRLRTLAHAFSVEFSDSATRLMATAEAQYQRTGGIDMETEIGLAEIADAIERQAKTDLNVHAIESAVYRHREEVADWLRDPCYDLEGAAKIDADVPLLRAFAHVALEAGSPNVANAMYVLRLEKRVATLESRAAMTDAMDHDEAEASRAFPRLGG